MSKERPILFNTEMVQAIQSGRKTQTRRIVKPQPETLPEHLLEAGMNIIHKGKLCKLHEPYGYAARTRGELIVKPVKPPCRPGDILWVRETWTPFCINKKTCRNALLGHSDFCYKASPDCVDEMDLGCKWHPSIHMPKEAARLFLRVKDVRVERLRNMSYSDLANEGFGSWERFISLWDSTIKPEDCYMYDWNANPWVWVIEFEQCQKPEGWCEARS